MKRKMLVIGFILGFGTFGCGWFGSSPSAPVPVVQPLAQREFLPIKYVTANLIWQVADRAEQEGSLTKAVVQVGAKLTKAILKVHVPDDSLYTSEQLTNYLFAGGNGISDLLQPPSTPVLIILDKKNMEVRYVKITDQIEAVTIISQASSKIEVKGGDATKKETAGAGINKIRIENSNPMKIWLWCDDESKLSLRFEMRHSNTPPKADG